MGATNNVKVLEAGIAKAKVIIKKSMLNAGQETAEELVRIAAETYEEHEASLTGNLINSIMGGVYFNKFLERICTVNKAADMPVATHTYTRVGDGGFIDYDSGERVEFVKQYKGGEILFQRAERGGTGYDSALNFLSSYRPKSSFLEIVICAAAPYAEYIQKVRGLDILTSSKLEASGVFEGNLIYIRKL
jgi:hypothetical protein